MGINNFSKIVHYLVKNPNVTLNNISKNTAIPKKTVNKIIVDLIKENLIIKNIDQYSLSKIFLDYKISKFSDVYFNFKIKEEHKQKIYYLFYKIKEQIYKSIGKDPTKTQMQKLIIEINNKINLGLPVMWYKYGQITSVAYNPQIDYFKLVKIKIKDIPDEIIYETINENIIEHSKMITTKEIKKKQYYSNNSEINKLYQLKDQMLEQAYLGNFEFLQKNIKNMIFLKPYFKDMHNIINDFYDFIIHFTDMYNKFKTTKLKNLGIEAYNIFWDYIAIYNCIYDIENYYKANDFSLEGFSKNTVNEIYEIKEKFDNIMDRFYEQYNLMNFIDNEKVNKLLKKITNNY